MAGERELKIEVDLCMALGEVLGQMPATPEPVVVVSVYLYSLAKGYGLSDSHHLDESQLGRADPPASAVAVINHFLTDGAASIDGDSLRDRLYSVFVDLSRDGQARQVLNKNQPLSEIGLLKVAQVFWNLEASETRRLLPIASGRTIDVDGGTMPADIKVPHANKDFATMTWTERTQYGADGLGPGTAHKSSGQGFRTKGARLAVLAAQHLVKAHPQPAPTMGGAILHISTGQTRPRARITWPDDDRPVTELPISKAQQEETTGSFPSPAGVTDPGIWAATTRGSVIDHSLARLKQATAFQGRSAELGELTRFCDTGDDQRLLVTGERYSGKSALMAEFLVHVETPGAFRLGYFVPRNRRTDARSEAMVRHLVRQAYLLTTGQELHIDSSNPGRLKELLGECVTLAQRNGQRVVVMVDGIDEDISAPLQEQTMMSVLEDLSMPGLKILISAWSDRIPEEAAGWRRLDVQRTDHVAENLRQMEAELETLFSQAPARDILQYLTFGSGPFQAVELAQLSGRNVRDIRKVLKGSEERVFSIVPEPDGEDRWGFAHPKYSEVSRVLFDESAGVWSAGELTPDATMYPDTEVQVRLESWADSFRNAGWPTETSGYLLNQYPEFLTDRGNLTGLCRLLFDAEYLHAIARRLGPANPIPRLVDQAMPLALRAAEKNGNISDLEVLAKLGSIRDNYRTTPERLPLVLLESVSRIHGKDHAARLANHIIERGITYPSGTALDAVERWTVENEQDGALIRALVRAGLADMATEFVRQIWSQSKQPEPDRVSDRMVRSRHELVRALLDAGDTQAAAAEIADFEHEVHNRLHEKWKKTPNSAASLGNAYSVCTKLYYEAGDHSNAARLSSMVLETYKSLEEPDSEAFAFSTHSPTACALAWGGRPEQALQMLPEELADMTLEKLIVQSGPSQMGLEYLDPLRFVHALTAIGPDRLVREFFGTRLVKKLPEPIQIVLMLAAGLTAEAFAAVDALPATLGPLAKDHHFPDGTERWQTFLFGLIAGLHPESTEAARVVGRMKSLADGAMDVDKPYFFSQLASALVAINRDDEIEPLLGELDDPGVALLECVESAAQRGDLHAVLRWAHHDQWKNPLTNPSSRINALARLAICQDAAGNRTAARNALNQALTLAADPIVTSNTMRQVLVDAAAGRDLRWETALTQGVEDGLLGAADAARAMPEPQEHLAELEAMCTRIHAMLLDRYPSHDWYSGWADEGLQADPPSVPEEMREAYVNRAFKVSAPLDWGGWQLVYQRVAETLSRAGHTEAAIQFGNWGVEMAGLHVLRGGWYRIVGFDGASLLRAAHLGVVVNSATFQDLLSQVSESFDKEFPETSSRQFRDSYRVPLLANQALTLAAIGRPHEARTRASELATTLTTSSTTTWLSGGGDRQERGLLACMRTLVFLGDLDFAVPLVGYLSDADVAAQANATLSEGYFNKGDTRAAIQYAALAATRLSWTDMIETLRQLDPALIAKIAQFEDDLRRPDSVPRAARIQ